MSTPRRLLVGLDQLDLFGDPVAPHTGAVLRVDLDPVDVDLFAGPGGWDQGVRALGVAPLGIEWKADACATAEAAGHRRLQADIATLDPATVLTDHFGPGRSLRGLIASPPCQGFSMAGKGRGRDDAALLLEAVPAMVDRDVRGELHERMTDPRSVLVLEPLRWALELRPEWCAWEQVPAVLPIWEACAAVLRALGYTVAVGVLNAEQHGVPQTRQRAILVARSPRLTELLGPAALPAPTHSRYYSRTPVKLDAGVAKWVSMADALGWNPGDLVGFPRRADTDDAVVLDGIAYRARDLHPADRPAPALTEKVRSWQRFRMVKCQGAGMVARHGDRPPREPDQPAFTITGADGGGSVRYKFEEVSPATTSTPLRRRVTVAEAAVLQTFPADYPWQGTKTGCYRQVGDAVPPLLAQVVVAAVSGLALAADEDSAAA